MADAGKIQVGVELDASDAFKGFTDAVMAEVRPALEQVRREIDNQMAQASGGGGKAGSVFGEVFGGSFLGSFSSQILTKGLAVIEEFASKAANAVKGILEGGWDRLTAIDTAKTKMEALGNSAFNVQKSMDSALKAVKGTAFGLQDAANAAATALAAGVEPGKQLTDYLKLIADTAAIAKRSGEQMGTAFESTGQVINKITTQGYATNEELQQLSERQIGIYVALANQLHITTGEVIQMAEKTGIAGSKVREALESIVGGAALKMGESFEGAAANIEASFDRIGAAFLKPIFQPAKDGVSSLQGALNELEAWVNEHQSEIVGFFGGVGQAMITLGEVTANTVSLIATELGTLAAAYADAFDNIADIIDRLAGPLKALEPVVPSFLRPIIDTLPDVASNMHEAADGARDFAKTNLELGANAKVLAEVTLPNASKKLGTWITDVQQSIAYEEKWKNSIVNNTTALAYQGSMLEWIARVRAGQDPGPMPQFRPDLQQFGWFGANPAPGGPPDTVKLSGGGSSSSNTALWLPPGTPIPLPGSGPLGTTSGSSSGYNWDALAQAESSGNWQINTGNGYFGGLQFDMATWRQYGGEQFAKSPELATKEQQIQVAERAIADRHGGQTLWPKNWGLLTNPPSGGPTTAASSYTGIPGGIPYGLPLGSNSGGFGGGGVQFPAWVYQLGAAFGLQPSTYPGHQEGRGTNQGIDWTGPVDALQRFAEALTSLRPQGLDQVIWQNPQTKQALGLTPQGQVVTDTTGYYRDDFAGHQNHVHTRFFESPIFGGGFPGIGPGVLPSSPVDRKSVV